MNEVTPELDYIQLLAAPLHRPDARSSQFDTEVLGTLERQVAELPRPALRNTYRELAQICFEINAREQTQPGKILSSNIVSTQEKLSEQEILSVWHYHGFITVLLKSAYMLADIFLCQFIGALHCKESMSMKKFMYKDNSKFADLSSEELLAGYCIAIYRNKLVAHYDIRRLGGSATKADGARIIAPMPEEFSLSEEDKKNLLKLEHKYEDSLADIEKPFDLLNALFYKVPVGRVGQINPHRTRIDKIAEKGGCYSKSSLDLLSSVDLFCSGMLRCVG